MSQQHLITNSVGTIGSLHPKAFGFIVFITGSGRRIRIYFHRADSDATDFQVGDKVSFDIGIDSQNRPRAYNVKFIEAAPTTVEGGLR